MLNHIRSLLFATNVSAEIRQANHLALPSESMVTSLASPFREVWLLFFPEGITNDERIYRLYAFENVLRYTGFDSIFTVYDSRLSYTLGTIRDNYTQFEGRLTCRGVPATDLVVDTRSQIKRSQSFSRLQISIATNHLEVKEIDSEGAQIGDALIEGLEVNANDEVHLATYGLTLTMPTTISDKTWLYCTSCPLDFDLVALYENAKLNESKIQTMMIKPGDSMTEVGDNLWKLKLNPARALAGLLISFITRVQKAYYS